MTKRKILLLAMSLCMVAILAVGGTLAYFTDTDSATNVFTVGNVDITLNETFDEGTAKLVPGVDINKDVTITLKEGSEESWVWYTYAIPAEVDSPDKLEDSINNFVHVNHAGANWLGFQNNQAYWAEGQTTATPEEKCWIPDYDCTQGVNIDGVLYNVYSVLYNGTLTAKETTTIGMTNVYMDAAVDTVLKDGKTYYVLSKNGKSYEIEASKLNGMKIIVNAYAIQAAGFNNVQEAYAAYNEQAK